MAETCGRGHEMVGDNIMRYGVAKQTRCRECYQLAYRERSNAPKPKPSGSGRKSRPPLDPQLVAELRRRAGMAPGDIDERTDGSR